MGAALKITQTDHAAAGLRAQSARCSHGAQVRWMLALPLVLKGRRRSEVAEFNGMDRQTLRDWVHRYNIKGVDGPELRRSPGREPFLSKQQKAELREFVVQGPDPDIHEVVRWQCADLRAEVARRWSVEVHESSIGKWLGALDLTRLQPGLVPPRKDAAAEAAFKQTSQAWCVRRLSMPHHPVIPAAL